jgi:hypothetical protein
MSRPEGNDRYVRNAPKNPKETRWMYDDDVSSLCVVGYTSLRYRLYKGLETFGFEFMMTIMTISI